MNQSSSQVAIVIGAVIAVVLQIVVAPNIMISYAMPNFLLAYVVVVSIACAQSCGYILPFVLGMLFDLMGGGPVGASALLYLIVTFVLTHMFALIDKSNIVMPLVSIVVAIALTECVYGGIVSAISVSASFVDMLLYRALPCAVFDGVFGIIMYPLVNRFIAERSQPSIPSSPLIG